MIEQPVGYAEPGLEVAVELVNHLVIDAEQPTAAVLGGVLSADPTSAAALRPVDAEPFARLAADLHTVLGALADGDEDLAAVRLNDLLHAHPAHPHLARVDGEWRLRHHPGDADLAGTWSAICAEALARLLAAGWGSRAGACADPRCGRYFVDTTRNGSRRFCTITCQNRIKTAAHRARRTG